MEIDGFRVRVVMVACSPSSPSASSSPLQPQGVEPAELAAGSHGRLPLRPVDAVLLLPQFFSWKSIVLLALFSVMHISAAVSASLPEEDHFRSRRARRSRRRLRQEYRFRLVLIPQIIFIPCRGSSVFIPRRREFCCISIIKFHFIYLGQVWFRSAGASDASSHNQPVTHHDAQQVTL